MLDNGRRCLISVRQHSLPCLLQIIFRPQRYTPIRSPLLVRVREPTDRKSESPPFGLLHHSKMEWTVVRRIPTIVCFVQLQPVFLCIAGRHLNPASFSMLSLVKLLVVDRREQCHVLVVRILCMRTLNRRGCVQLLYSSEILGPKYALKKRAHACSFFKRTQKTRAK